MTASQHGITPPDAARLHRQSHRVLSDRPGDRSTSGTGTAIDRVLELVGRRQLSATDVRDSQRYERQRRRWVRF